MLSVQNVGKTTADIVKCELRKTALYSLSPNKVRLALPKLNTQKCHLPGALSFLCIFAHKADYAGYSRFEHSQLKLLTMLKIFI